MENTSKDCEKIVDISQKGFLYKNSRIQSLPTVSGSTTLTVGGSKMETKQLSLPGTLVKKDNRLIRSKVHVASLDASRIIANLISCINVTDTEFKDIYKVAIKDFFPDKSGRGYFRAKSICKELIFSYAEIENLGEEQLSLIPFFRQIDYKSGIVYAEFNINMKPLLLELQKCFTEYNLIEYLKLPSIYSQHIFEILKSWNDRQEVTISISDLHRILNIPESFRRYPDFRRFVLEKAHKDIINNTTLYYEWEPVKKGRSVEAIRFIFSKKRALPVLKSKEIDAQEKQSKKNRELFLAAVACHKERGPNCEGGRQKKSVCEMCRRLNAPRA